MAITSYKIVPTSSNLDIMIRRKEVVNLRGSGMKFDEISEYMKQKYGELIPDKYCGQSAYTDFRNEVARLKSEEGETASELKWLDNSRLEKLILASFDIAMEGNLKAMEIAVKLMERRAKLMGLDAPQQTVTKSWQSEIAELLISGQVSVDEVRKEIGDELYSRSFSNLKLPEETNQVDTKFEEVSDGIE